VLHCTHSFAGTVILCRMQRAASALQPAGASTLGHVGMWHWTLELELAALGLASRPRGRARSPAPATTQNIGHSRYDVT